MTPPSPFVPVEKPPTILFRHSQGPIAQTNDGKLLVYPGTVLHMECLWMRRFGNPKWNVTHFEPEWVWKACQEYWRIPTYLSEVLVSCSSKGRISIKTTYQLNFWGHILHCLSRSSVPLLLRGVWSWTIPCACPFCASVHALFPSLSAQQGRISSKSGSD